MIVMGGRRHFVIYDSFWYLLFLLSLDASVEIEHVVDGAIFLWVPYLILFLVIGAAIWASAMARHLWHRNWRRVISLILVPVTVVAFCSLANRHGFDVTWARFKMNEEKYRADLAKLPSSRAPKQMEWHWGSTGFAGSGNSESTIVYDESGAIERARNELATGSRVTECLRLLSCFDNAPYSDDISIHRVEDKFYLVTLSFQ
jgi:hypothetical protein